MELNKVLQHAAGRDGLRMIVLTGIGSVFSSGYDLAEAGGRRNIESGNPTIEDGLERRRITVN